MPIQLRWSPNESASILHAAAMRMAGFAAADPTIDGSLGPAVETLQQALSAVGVAPAAFFEHAIPLSRGNTPPREAVHVALAKVLGRVAAAAGTETVLTGWRELERAARQLWPRLTDELALRIGPLQELWEGRGPGLLTAVGRTTDAELIADQADVMLVHPYANGAGAAHKAYNAVRIEAVLANPVPAVPEVVRLAWLLSMLHLDLPRYSELVSPARLPRVGALAMVPPVLEAAAWVELIASADAVRVEALQTWHLVPPDSTAAETTALADTLADWWSTYQTDRPSWRVALTALDQMLEAAGGEQST